MELRFDHIHQNKMFKFIRNDYDPERLIKKIQTKCEELASMYNLQIKFDRQLFFEYEIKDSDIYCVLCTIFSNDELNMNLEFDLLIPDIKNSFVTISGVRRYIQKQIRDTLYITMKSQVKQKCVCEFNKSFTLHQRKTRKNTETSFSINIQDLVYLDAIATYKLLLNENEDNLLYDIDNPVLQNILKDYELYNKDKLFKLLNNTISLSQKKRALEYFKVYYALSDIYQKFFKSPSEIIYKLFKHLEDINDDEGLNLEYRRLRNTEELIYSCFLSLIIDHVLDTIFISSKNKREKQFKLEPFQYLYDFALVENQFDAPLASVSNRARCTISGEGGFSKDGIPVRVRNLHPTQYNCLDPAVTPDRDNAGVVLYLSSTCELDEIGRFKIDENFLNYFNLNGGLNE